MKTFGERLRKLRQDRGMSLDQFSELLGMKKSTLSHYERGCREPDFQRLVDLAFMLNTTPNYLLGFEAKDADLTTFQHDYTTKDVCCNRVNQQTSVCLVKAGCLLRNEQNGALEICARCYGFTVT